jgi:anti-sigma factor RsiW
MLGNHVRPKLSAYLHGELPPATAQRVAAHLLRCPRCQQEFDEIKFGAQLAAQLAPTVAPKALWDELSAALEQAEPARARNFGATNSAPPARRLFPVWLSFKPALVGALLILIAASAYWFYQSRPQPSDPNAPAWAVTRLAGAPAIGKQKIGATGRLAVGQWLVTDEQSRAQISVGEIGEVQIEPNSRVRLVEARADEHRLALTRGRMHAFIWAPPRQFYVDTPSAVAVDLGCAYTLDVDDDGQALLRVTMGWVAFEWQGRESFVPAEAACVTRPGIGPGTPYFGDAPADFQNALARFDTAQADEAARTTALNEVLAQARQRDGLTLWHLLTRTEGDGRSRVYDRLAELWPPPPHVDREGVLRGNRVMLDAWWDRLGHGNTRWWRMWKGPLPTQNK